MKKLFFVLLSVLTLSCTKDDVDCSVSNNEEGVLTFVSKGVVYSSPYFYSDSSIVVKDKNVNAVYSELQKWPELATLVKNDTLYFYETYRDMLVSNLKSYDALRSGKNCHWTLSMYKKAYYSGEYYHFYGTDNYYQYSMPAGFDNKVSSIKFHTQDTDYNVVCVLTLYDDGGCDNHVDHKRSFSIIGENSIDLDNLDNYRRSTWGRTWDDKISSFKVIVE